MEFQRVFFFWYIVLNGFEGRKVQLFLLVDRLFVSSPCRAPSPQLQSQFAVCLQWILIILRLR